MTTAEPGRLTKDQSAELAQLRPAARLSGDCEPFVEVVTTLRAAGVPVARIAVAAGVGENRIRQVYRAHGHQPPAVRVPGWVPGREAAQAIEVLSQRLAAAWPAGRPPGSPGPSAGTGSGASTAWPSGGPVSRAAETAARRRAERDRRIRELAAGG